ncbi:MAG: MlaD family protein [Polyangiales bacterium]
MRNLSRSLKVGLLLIAAVAASVTLWRVLFRQQGGSGSYTVYALFNDATGLVPRSRVLTAGIAVGEIERIRLQGGKARIDIRLNQGVQLYANATVSRRAVSLLGEFLLTLTPGTPDRARLSSGGRITQVFEGSSTDEIMNNAAAITENVRRVTDRLSESLGNQEAAREMREILRNVAELTASVNRTVQQNGQVVTHTLANIDRLTTESSPDVRLALNNVREATDRLAQILGRGQPREDNTVTQVREATRNVASASRELRETLEHVNHTTGAIDRGEGTLGRLVRDEALIDEVQGAAEGVNDLVGGIARLQTIVGLRSEYNFISNTLRSYVELRLQPREDKYYLLEFVDDPRGATRVVSTVTDTTDPRETAHVRTTQRITTDAFRFSIMFARRYGPATFRFGIKESTGGVGLDLHLFNDSLEIRNDLFGFGESANPRLRIAAAFNILQRAWIIAGVDDILNGDRFDYFLGAQLRFNDDDIKSILPFAGGLGGSR